MTSDYNRHVLLAEVLTQAVENRGWKQPDLARAVGIGQQAVSKWMLGQTRPRPDVIPLVAEALGLDEINLQRVAGYLRGTGSIDIQQDVDGQTFVISAEGGPGRVGDTPARASARITLDDLAATVGRLEAKLDRLLADSPKSRS